MRRLTVAVPLHANRIGRGQAAGNRMKAIDIGVMDS